MDPKHASTAGNRWGGKVGDSTHERTGLHTVITREYAAIRRWATLHGAEPATGEATSRDRPVST